MLKMMKDNLDIIYLLLEKYPTSYITQAYSNRSSLLFRLPNLLDEHYLEVLTYLVDEKGLSLDSMSENFNLLDSLIIYNKIDKEIFKYILDNWSINLTNGDINRYIWCFSRNNNVEKNENGEYDIIIWIKDNYPISN